MILRRLVLPGNYVEAHLYFDFLWLVDVTGAVKAFDISEFIDKRMNGSSQAALKVFARNDWLVLNESKRSSVQDQTPEVQKFLSTSGEVFVESGDVDDFSYHYASNIDLEQPLDVRFYYGRAFVGVPGALMQFQALGRDDMSLQFSGKFREKNLKIKKVFDEGTPIHIQCRYGCVNFACGPEGGFIGLGALSSDLRWEISPHKIAEVSFFTEVNRAGVGHVGSAAHLQLNSVSVRKANSQTQRSEQKELWEVADIGEKDDAAMSSVSRAVKSNNETNATPERMFLTTNKAIVVMSDNKLKMFSYQNDGKFVHGDPRVYNLDMPRGRILSTTTTGGRIVVECDDDVFMLNDRKWVNIFEGPVYSVRGYPSSKWYRQLITIVAEERVDLLFVGDE